MQGTEPWFSVPTQSTRLISVLCVNILNVTFAVGHFLQRGAHWNSGVY